MLKLHFGQTKKIHTPNKYSNGWYIVEAFQITELICNSCVFRIKLPLNSP